MKVEIIDEPVGFSVNLLKPGQMGKIVDAHATKYIGHIVLRTYCGLVSLTDPTHTWDWQEKDSAPRFYIMPIRAVTLREN